MLRLAELALFLAPFVIFAVWRFSAMEGGPSVWVVVAAACMLVVLAATLVWLSQERTLPPRTAYEPAHFQDGQVTSGQAVPR
jgi:hypothetical protein